MNKLLYIGTCLILFACGIWCGHASAAPPPEGWGAHEIHIAEQWWGRQPTMCTSLNIEFDSTNMDNEGAAGEATEPTEPEPCIMHIRPVSWIVGLCEIVLHEYGHLLGYGHDSDPHSIMYGVPWSSEPGAPAWEPAHVGSCWAENGLKRLPKGT